MSEILYKQLPGNLLINICKYMSLINIEKLYLVWVMILFFFLIFLFINLFCSTMETDRKNKMLESDFQEIVEGEAKIKTAGKVFYNPVQEFNRDLR